ncbi:MAG: hypothetical protein R3E68_14915 [Burkholderiaceae bacterium]
MRELASTVRSARRSLQQQAEQHREGAVALPVGLVTVVEHQYRLAGQRIDERGHEAAREMAQVGQVFGRRHRQPDPLLAAQAP